MIVLLLIAAWLLACALIVGVVHVATRVPTPKPPARRLRVVKNQEEPWI